MIKYVSYLIFAFALLLGACTNSTIEDSDKIIITTTIAQIGDAVKNIGGEHVDVHSLMGPGVDPHIYQATQSDIRRLGDADIIFYNGLNLEGNMVEIFEKMRNEKPTFAVTDAIPKQYLLQDMDDVNEVDPHIWFDIDLWSMVVEYIAEQLIEYAPEYEEDFKNNSEKYLAELTELKIFAKNEMEKVPEQSRILVTAHDAFGYFANAYGFEVVGIQGLSTDSDYGIRDIQNVIDILVENEIKAVFTESSVSDRAMNSVIEGAKARGFEVEIGGSLFSDAMGEEGTEEGTYIGMYKHNVNVIVESLQ